MSERRTTRQHTLVIDRFVDEATAVVEIDGLTLVPIPRQLLPAAATSDSVLRVTNDPHAVSITMDPAATASARREGARLAGRLRTRDPGGDVSL